MTRRPLPPWPEAAPLREWQARAFMGMREAHQQGAFLTCATPGAGKTTLGLYAGHRMLERGFIGRIVVIAPTTHICHQWSRAAARVGLDLEPCRSIMLGIEPRDRHGIAITYAGLATDPISQRAIAERIPTLVIVDEPHHAGEESTWGQALEGAFAPARFVLLITGTPWRTSGEQISFVRYEDDECSPDFTYGYRDALADGIVRPIAFHFFEGDLAWEAGGETHSASFADNVSRIDAGRRLRSAISDGPWMDSVLAKAHDRLMAIREADDPAAGGLVICESKAHAERMTERMTEMLGEREQVVCVTSDHADATKRISDFAASRTPWIVAVAMISEGVDIPRLRVGAWATPIRTELNFAQTVGRFVRRTATAGEQIAHIFLPDDPALRAHAKRYEQDRRYILRERQEQVAQRAVGERPASDFEALSGEARLAAVMATGGHVVEPVASITDDEAEAPRSAAEQREAERTKRRGLIARYVKAKSVSHRQANIDANRAAGIRSVDSATLAELRTANTWLRAQL